MLFAHYTSVPHTPLLAASPPEKQAKQATTNN
jgi:hypothetical protein